MEPPKTQKVLKDIDGRQGRTPLVLFAVGAFLLLAPAFQAFLPAPLTVPIEWNYITQFCLGLLFLYVGALIHERQRLNRSFRELLSSFEAFNRGLYGEDYRETLKAIELLIRTLSSDDAEVREKVHAQLLRLTGLDLPPDQGAWFAWWNKEKWRFLSERARKQASAVSGKEGPATGGPG